MDDQDDINLEGSDAGSGEGGSKKGAGMLPQLLKWVAIPLGPLIFFVTIVVVTVNIMNGGGKSQSPIPLSEEYTGQREVLAWFSQALGTIQTRTADPIPASVVVDVALGYDGADKIAPTELSSRIIELKDFLRSYFQWKTADELKNEAKVKIELRNAINDNILTKSKIKDVRFIKYEIIEQ